MRGDADIAPIGALIGDPTRARVLMALTDGRALPASRLAAEAGVAPSTVSEHLARLLAAGLVTMHPEGRSRFYRLSSAEVAEALEALARIAPDQPIRSLRQGSHARALREARTCYNHLAGLLGTGLLTGFLSDGLLAGGDGRHHQDRAVHDRLSAPGRDLSYRLTGHGEDVLSQLGLDLDAVLARRPAVRYCLDWSEQRHHLAGPLGTALADAVRTRLGTPHPAAPRGPGHRGGPGQAARGPRAARRLGGPGRSRRVPGAGGRLTACDPERKRARAADLPGRPGHQPGIGESELRDALEPGFQGDPQFHPGQV